MPFVYRIDLIDVNPITTEVFLTVELAIERMRSLDSDSREFVVSTEVPTEHVTVWILTDEGPEKYCDHWNRADAEETAGELASVEITSVIRATAEGPPSDVTRVRDGVKAETNSLIKAAIDGQSDALGEVLGRFAGRLHRIARHEMSPRLQVRVSPEDVIQTTFMKVVRDIASFTGNTEHEFWSWLRAILIHTIQSAVTTHVTTQKRSVYVERSMDDGFTTSERSTKQSTGIEAIVFAEDREAVRSAVASLPASQARAIRLRHIDGCGIQDVALSMNRSQQAAAGLIKRGLQTLRQQEILAK